MKSLRSTERREPVAPTLAASLRLHRNVLLLEAGTAAFGGPVELDVIRIAARLALDELVDVPCRSTADVQAKLLYVLDGEHGERIRTDLIGAGHADASERLARFLRSLMLPAAPRGRRPSNLAHRSQLRTAAVMPAPANLEGST